MAAMIQPTDPESSQPPAARLTIVEPAAPAEVSTIGRGVVRGALLGWLAVTATATVLGRASGMSLLSAFGFANMVSVWGGLGFGAMMGGTVAFTHDLESQRKR